MRYLAKPFILLMAVMGLSLWSHANSKCGDVVGQVESVLRDYGSHQPISTTPMAQVGAADSVVNKSDALKSFGVASRNVPDSLDDLQSYTRNIPQDVAFLEARAGRALKDSTTRAQAQNAIDAKLDEVNRALTKISDHSGASVSELHKAKSDLLKLKMSEGRSLQDLKVEELLDIQKELAKRMHEGGARPLSSIPENVKVEASLKSAVEAELKKRPDYLKIENQKLEAAGTEFRQHQRQAEINFRDRAGTPAAKVLSDTEKTKIEAYVKKLQNDPTGLTRAEVDELQQIQKSISEKQKWRGGSYTGMTSTDVTVANNLDQALNQASHRLNEGSVEVLNLAKRQGRAIQPVKMDNFGTDAFGRHTGSARLSTQAERKAQMGTARTAIQELESAGTRPSGNIQEIAVFHPVVRERATVNNISSSLSRVGVQADEIRAANVVSTLNAGDVDGALVDFRKAQDFLRQVREASRSGELQQATQTLTDMERRSLNQLIETMEAHQRSYVPSHLRNLRN